MNMSIRPLMLNAFAACLLALHGLAGAQEKSNAPAETPLVATDHWVERHSGEHEIVHIGTDSHLAAGDTANSVVAIVGSVVTEGEVSDSVVAVMGSVRVTGPVGDGVVAVMGNAYINSKIGGDVVAVMGDVELGPQAEIGGDVVSVGGKLIRDPEAVIHGNTSEVTFPFGIGQLEWIHPWVKHALLYGRPLAIAPGLGWAWALALGFLALYVFLALLFPGAVERCARTFETRPGASLLAAILGLLLTPIAMMLLFITVIGIVLVPFFGIAFFFVGLFGKAVILAVAGRRITGRVESPFNHVAIAVLIGGLMVLALYLVPIVGFITYKLTGLLGFGVVIYTLLLEMRAKRDTQGAAAVPGAAAPAATAFATPHVEPKFSDPRTSYSNTSAGESPPGAEGPAMSDSTVNSSSTSHHSTSTQSIPAGAAVSLPRANFGLRMVAMLVDIVLVAVVLNMVFDHGRVFGTFLVPLAAYGAVMWKLKGSTIGGIICHLQVVRLDGREIDWATAIVRALGCFLSLIVVGLGFLWVLFDSERQAWHDKIAGTVVVRVPKGAPLV